MDTGKHVLACFRNLSILRTVNRCPQFSAALQDILESRGLTQLAAAKISGLSRQILIRFLRGSQWPQPEHIGKVFQLADSPDEKSQLLNAINGDIAAAAGLPRFGCVADGGEILIRVPENQRAVIDRLIFLYTTDGTVRIVLDSIAKIAASEGSSDSKKTSAPDSVRPDSLKKTKLVCPAQTNSASHRKAS